MRNVTARNAMPSNWASWLPPGISQCMIVWLHFAAYKRAWAFFSAQEHWALDQNGQWSITSRLLNILISVRAKVRMIHLLFWVHTFHPFVHTKAHCIMCRRRQATSGCGAMSRTYVSNLHLSSRIRTASTRRVRPSRGAFWMWHSLKRFVGNVLQLVYLNLNLNLMSRVGKRQKREKEKVKSTWKIN